MSAQGMAIMGTATAEGDNRAVEAATSSIASPLLENISIEGATGIIINVTGGPGLSLYEVNEASTLITEAAHEDAEIIFGAVIDESMGDQVRVTVIATGFNQHMAQHPSMRVTTPEQMQIMAQQMKVARQAMSYETQHMYQQPVQQIPIPPPTYIPPQPQQPMYQQQPPVQQQAPVQQQPQQPMEAQPVQQPQVHTPPPVPQAPVEQRVEEQKLAENLPPIPPQQRVEAPVTPPQQPVEEVRPVVESQPNVPVQQQVFAPPQPAEKSGPLPRDILLAKARAYKEQTAQQSRQPNQEQLSMEMEEKAAEEEDVHMPLNQNDLDVPTYLRRQQSKLDNMEG